MREVDHKTGCEGDPTTFYLTASYIDADIMNFDPADPSILTRRLFYCSSSIAHFKTTYEDGDRYEWFFDDGRTGSIISGQGTNVVAIMLNEWDHAIGQGFPELRCRITKCGGGAFAEPLRIGVDYGPDFISDLDPNISYCSGESIDVMFTTDPNNIPPNYDLQSFSYGAMFYGIDNTNGNRIRIDYTNPTYQFLPPNRVLVENLELPQVENQTIIGFLLLIYTSECGQPWHSSRSLHDVFMYPSPDIQISPSGTEEVCQGSALPVINSSLRNSQIGPVSYRWYKNGVAIPDIQGGDESFYAASTSGLYHLETYFDNMPTCTAVSETLSITTVPCGPNDPDGNGSDCTGSSSSVSVTWSACDEITLNFGHSGGTPLSTHYDIADLEYTEVSSGAGQAVITGDWEPGTYRVTYAGNYATCVARSETTVDIGYQPQMAINVDCLNGSYDVTVIDNSTAIANSQPNMLTDFEIVGVGSVVASTNDSETFTNLSDGNYTARISIADGNGPVCIAEIGFTLQAPDAAFTVHDARDPNGPPITETCTECPVILKPTNPYPDMQYEWSFNSGAINTMESPEVTLIDDTGQGSVDISFGVTSEWGCSANTVTQTITVYSADFEDGILSVAAQPIVRESRSIYLTATPLIPFHQSHRQIQIRI